MHPSEKTPAPYKAVFPRNAVLWEGDLEDAGATFVVSDILDGGVSELAVTGRKPDLRVPVERIHDQGGRVLPYGSDD
jgi:hypothetical protein